MTSRPPPSTVELSYYFDASRLERKRYENERALALVALRHRLQSLPQVSFERVIAAVEALVTVAENALSPPEEGAEDDRQRNSAQALYDMTRP